MNIKIVKKIGKMGKAPFGLHFGPSMEGRNVPRTLFSKLWKYTWFFLDNKFWKEFLASELAFFIVKLCRTSFSVVEEVWRPVVQSTFPNDPNGEGDGVSEGFKWEHNKWWASPEAFRATEEFCSTCNTASSMEKLLLRSAVLRYFHLRRMWNAVSIYPNPFHRFQKAWNLKRL